MNIAHMDYGHRVGYESDAYMAYKIFLSSLLLVGLVLLAIWLIRQFSKSSPTNTKDPEDPITIAKRRLAAGDISPEQYQKIRDTLADKSHTPPKAVQSDHTSSDNKK